MQAQRALLAAVLLLAVLGGLRRRRRERGDEATTAFTVQADGWSLSPANVAVPSGEEVTVTFENVGSNQHNYGVDVNGDGKTEDDDRTETIPSGETAELTFTIDEPGESAYYCDLPGHRDAGMEGTLTVTDG